jgi:response regulator RpfG family c-di-GMP phosphodiesterase
MMTAHSDMPLQQAVTPPLGSTAKHPAVLCVDDELPVLDGIERVLRSRFAVTRATNAADAIVALQYGGPFAVIMTDFRLAETDGVYLLARVRELAPDTVRLLLTGHAGMDDAIAAINEGHVYGFVRKPCRPEMLIERVGEAVQHHRLLVGERELLEQMLHGSIKALTDLLALTCPIASGRATRLTRYACDLAAALRVERWEIEIAAMVSQIGCVTLPPELAERICRGDALTPHEQATAERLPLIAETILGTIPRLNGVRAILHHQRDRYDQRGVDGLPSGVAVPIGARVLRVAADFDTLDSQGVPVDQAIRQLTASAGVYDPTVLAALLAASSFLGADLETVELMLRDVKLGMVFVTDVMSPVGILLIARGQDVTPSLQERIRNHWAAFAERQRVRVVIHKAG